MCVGGGDVRALNPEILNVTRTARAGIVFIVPNRMPAANKNGEGQRN